MLDDGHIDVCGVVGDVLHRLLEVSSFSKAYSWVILTAGRRGRDREAGPAPLLTPDRCRAP